MPEHRGALSGSGRRFALVVGRFNATITGRLHAGAVACLADHGVRDGDIHSFWVPGAFEIPLVALRLARSGAFDGVIALGAVIRGATPHFEAVAHQAARGVLEAALATGVPITFGVLTTDSFAQAIDRAGGRTGNRGREAALAALEMAGLDKAISGFESGD